MSNQEPMEFVLEPSEELTEQGLLRLLLELLGVEFERLSTSTGLDGDERAWSACAYGGWTFDLLEHEESQNIRDGVSFRLRVSPGSRIRSANTLDQGFYPGDNFSDWFIEVLRREGIEVESVT